MEWRMMERNENEGGVWRLIKFEEIGTWCYTRKVDEYTESYLSLFAYFDNQRYPYLYQLD